MSSLSRNIRRANSAVRSQALGAGLALALMSAAALADGAQHLVFTAFSDAAGGADVVAGRYDAALQELKTHPLAMNLDPSAIATNRCVAYSMTLRRKEARAACDAAVDAARDERNSQPSFWTQSSSSGEDYLTVAYANRAVMHWLLQDEAAARADLASAQALSPRAAFVVENLAALKTHRVLAEAGTPAPKS